MKRFVATPSVALATSACLLGGGTLSASAAEQASAASAPRLMPLGDSITDGVGSSIGEVIRVRRTR